MELVIDTNILISAVIARSTTLDLIFDERIKLFSTEYSFTEIRKHLNEISKKSKLSKKELDFLFSKLFSKTKIFSQEEYQYLKEKAKIISPNKDD
ncbi:MAG: hypothetical protein JW703_04335 [Candidatus Diapherotrites archaeon]|nr:hypothetical protein [Candidatus Diapherotrites archaeon]